MSKDAALAFLKMASEDESLQKKILELARTEGYAYTVEELSEEDLDQAAGGLKFDAATTLSYIKWFQPSPDQTIIMP